MMKLETKNQIKGKILVIEDDLDQSKLLERWLIASGGWEVTSIVDGNMGAHMALSGGWDLILSDIELPGNNGIEVLRQSKKSNPDTPVCLLTSHRKIDYPIHAMKYQADDFLLKPLRRKDLLEKVESLVTDGRLKREEKRNVVLAVGSHPDDVEIGCGGTLSLHAAKGDKIVILTLSDGTVGGQANIRTEEASRAAEILGAELIFGGLIDTEIGYGRETISVIESAVKKHKPSIIYTHSENERHQDHRNTYQATLIAARKVPNLYCYQSPSTTYDFRPVSFSNIENHLEHKLLLLSMYQSQTTVRPYLSDETIRANAIYWGRFADYKPVEAFEVIRESKNNHS